MAHSAEQSHFPISRFSHTCTAGTDRMVRESGVGVAMGNTVPDLKANADRIALRRERCYSMYGQRFSRSYSS